MSAVLRKSVWSYVVLIRIYIIGWILILHDRLCRKLNINTDRTEPSNWEKQHILYSQSWEDTRVLRKALHVSGNDEVISVAAAGDSLLALLLDKPRHIVGIDSSFPQIALCNLKVVGIKALAFEEFQYFLGFTENVPDGRKRREIYRCSLRSQLPDDARMFWDNHEQLLAHGLIHSGQFEQYLQTFTQLVVPLGLQPHDVNEILSQTKLSQQRHVLSRCWNNLQWHALYRFYFSEAMMRYSLGSFAAFRAMFRMTDQSVGQQCLSCITDNLDNIPVVNNYFLEYLLTGSISGKNSVPEYMQKDNFGILKTRVHTLQLVHGDLLTYLKSKRKIQHLYNAVHLANLPDSVPNLVELFEAVVNSIKSGARIVHWKFLVDRKSETLFMKHLRWDIKLSNSLKNEDRVFLFRELVIQTSKGQ